MSLLYFIIFIGVLVFVHELGHFLVAKYFDVKVLRFSIGFGPTLVSYQYGETEYCICALPLGGYVQMLGGDFEGVEHLSPEERERALMSKPIWQRSLVVLAGPVFNFILPVIIYFIFTMMVTTTPPSVIGDVFEDMPASEVGLQAGDKIVEIDGDEINYWYEVIDLITNAPGREVALKVERDGEILSMKVTPEAKRDLDSFGLSERHYGLLGIHPATYGPTIGIEDPDGPAARAGLEHFDKVLTVNGEAIKRFDQLASKVRNSGGEALELTVMRREPIDVDYAQIYRQKPVELTLEPVEIDGEWSAKFTNAEMFLTRVEPGSVIEKSGLEVGDKLVAVNGKSFSNWRLLHRYIGNHVNEAIIAKTKEEGAGGPVSELPEFRVSYARDGEVKTTTLELTPIEPEKPIAMSEYLGWAHISDLEMPEEVPFPFFQRIGYAAETAVVSTWRFCKMTAMGVVRMAQGRLSLDNVGGPIMIGELAAKAGKAGWDKFLQMMALISINLGIINLLPIPILDGGQLLLFAIEALKRGPLSFRTRQIAAYIGFAMILFLIVLAFKNDIERQWDSISEYVNEI